MSVRAALCGGAALRDAAGVLGLEIVDERPAVVLVEIAEPGAIARAAAYPTGVPRVVVARDAEAELVRALGMPAMAVAPSADAAVIGPLVRAALPERSTRPTRLVVCASARGGVGRTLLVANLAARIGERSSVAALDVTGTGALGWWLRCAPRAWSDLEGLASELTPDHLSLVAAEATRGPRVIGGAPVAPSVTLVRAAARAALGLAELVLVDAPTFADERTRALCAMADRALVLTYDDDASLAALDATQVPDGAWLVVSQPRADRLERREVFRALPRDETSVAAALGAREPVRGALGRAYDDLAELLAADAAG